MSTSTNTQDIFRRILKSREEGYQLLRLIQKISADVASEKVDNVEEYLGVLLKIFNNVPTFLVFDNVPIPDEEPLPIQGQFYDIGIGMDGSLWWKDLTGWVKLWSPVSVVNLIKGETEIVGEFPLSQIGDVIYTPKGSVYQYTKGEPSFWRLIHSAYLMELYSVGDGELLQNEFGKDGDIAVDQNLRVYQKSGTWVLKATLNTYTKQEMDVLLSPKTESFVYNGSQVNFQVSEPKVNGIFSVHINQTPLFLGNGYTVNGNVVTITYGDKWENDVITIVYI